MAPCKKIIKILKTVKLQGYGFGGGAAGLTMDNGEQYGNTEFQT